MQLNVLNDLAEAKRRWKEKNAAFDFLTAEAVVHW